MYDAIRASYTFSCPRHGETHVTLSEFRRLDRLPGAAHPAVYRVHFACGCGSEHPGLVSHDELDWAPLGTTGGEFLDLMTAKVGDAGADLADAAATRIKAGEWPWSFFCYPEDRPRPVFPSAFVVLTPGDRQLGVAVRCPVCSSLSVNFVSRPHVDLPFWNDEKVGVVEHVFSDDAARSVERFRAELWSARFDERRMLLE